MATVRAGEIARTRAADATATAEIAATATAAYSFPDMAAVVQRLDEIAADSLEFDCVGYIEVHEFLQVSKQQENAAFAAGWVLLPNDNDDYGENLYEFCVAEVEANPDNGIVRLVDPGLNNDYDDLLDFILTTR